MNQLAQYPALVVSQQREYGEAFSGFEFTNRYVISDASGGVVFRAEEFGGNFLVRQILRSARPFSLNISGNTGERIAAVRRPFRFYFHRVEILNANDQPFGSVERKFSVLNRELVVEDAMGSERYRIQGPLFRPWTFYILRGEERVGKITKKWSGFVKEALTSADNFAIEFPHDASPEDRAILFGAVFLIDFAYFENDR